MSETIKVLRVGVIEDDRTRRLFLQKLLVARHGMDLVGCYESAETALAELEELRPDVVVVDLDLPAMSGAEVIRHLSSKLLNTAFLVLTSHDGPDEVFPALRAGASGYLLKHSQPQVIVEGIRSAFTGGAPLSPDISRLVIASFQKPPVANPQRKLPALSPRECEILDHLAKGKAPKEVASDLGISYETVRDHLKQVYQKLHVRSRTEAVIKYLQADES